MGLLDRNRFMSVPATSVPHADAQLVVLRDGFYKALSDHIDTNLSSDTRRRVSFAQVLWAHKRLNEVLDRRLELQRKEQEHFVEQWWHESHPCTAPPEWPTDDEEEAA